MSWPPKSHRLTWLGRSGRLTTPFQSWTPWVEETVGSNGGCCRRNQRASCVLPTRPFPSRKTFTSASAAAPASRSVYHARTASITFSPYFSPQTAVGRSVKEACHRTNSSRENNSERKGANGKRQSQDSRLSVV